MQDQQQSDVFKKQSLIDFLLVVLDLHNEEVEHRAPYAHPLPTSPSNSAPSFPLTYILHWC